MTVTELLAAIQAAYPGATSEALRTFVPVFHKRLAHREGDKLQEAADEVFAVFRPKFGAPFPIPVDFEQRMPAVHAPQGGPKLDMQGHRDRKRALMADWWARQGNGIKGARGAAVASACAHKAEAIAHMRAWATEQAPPIRLSADQIQTCEDQVVSSERMATHGARVLRVGDAEGWQSQMDQTRPEVRAGRSPSAERKARGDRRAEPEIMTSTGMLKRLAELAAAKREGRATAEQISTGGTG